MPADTPPAVHTGRPDGHEFVLAELLPTAIRADRCTLQDELVGVCQSLMPDIVLVLPTEQPSQRGNQVTFKCAGWREEEHRRLYVCLRVSFLVAALARACILFVTSPDNAYNG